MHTKIPIDPNACRAATSTGCLPPAKLVASLVREAYDLFKDVDEGKVADYIPALARVSPEFFGICLVGVNGALHSIGDVDCPFSIQSISKPFVFALICETLGEEVAREKLGVNSTGLPFNSVMAIELNKSRTMNPMVNAGAIAASSLVPGTTPDEKWRFIQGGLSKFAGRMLSLNSEVYDSETATNLRNRGIAKLLEGYERMYCDALEATDIYTRQCSLDVTTRDLAIMAATLADGGVNPVTKQKVISDLHCKRVLAVLATAGLYELSGEWLYETGLPGKSGVSGGMFTVAPGKGGLAVFAPRLDTAGNSVKGQRVTKFLSEALGLNLFASRPEN
jgi:glutaminase